MKNKTEFITAKQWDSYSTRCQNQALKFFGKSRCSVGSFCSQYIAESRPYDKTPSLVVYRGWRQAMRFASNPSRPPLGWKIDGGMMTPDGTSAQDHDENIKARSQ